MQELALKYGNVLMIMAVQYAPRVLLALLTLWIGFWLTNFLVRMMKQSFRVRRVDRSLVTFLESLVSIGLKIMVLMTVAMMIGIQMTSFVALLGAAGLAVGLSLQGSLANLAGGMLILLLKHFEVGDDISVMAQRGIVEEIGIFSTNLRGQDGVVIILPNGPLSNGVILNYSRGYKPPAK